LGEIVSESQGAGGFFFEGCHYFGATLELGEINCRFSAYFEIERVARETTGSRLMPTYAAYMMMRN